MLIKILKNGELVSPIPRVYKGRLPETCYYNLIHGNKEGWEYRLSVDSRIAKVRECPEFKLDKNYYILRPLKRNGVPSKDKKGNLYQVISRDFDTTHKNNILLLWEINTKYTDVLYHVKGFVSKIGEGFNNETPAPVLELYGDCTLTIKAKLNDKVVREEIDIKLDTMDVIRRYHD